MRKVLVVCKPGGGDPGSSAWVEGHVWDCLPCVVDGICWGWVGDDYLVS